MATTFNIADIFVSLRMDAAKFAQGAAQASKAMTNLRKDMSLTKKAFDFARKNYLAYAGGIGAAISAAFAPVKNANAAKEILIASQTLGISAEKYQVLTRAAADYGIQMDKVADALKDFRDRQGEYLSTGGGELKDFMKMIAEPQGVHIQDLIKLPPDEALIKVQDLMDSAGLSAQAQTFMWESIADDASKLVPILSGGGMALKSWEDHLKRTGQIMSTDLVERLATINRNFSLIGGVIGGFGKQFTAGLAPHLEAVSNDLFKFLSNWTSASSTMAAAGDILGRALEFIAEHFRTIISLGIAYAAVMWALPAAIGAVATAVAILSGGFEVLKIALIQTGVGALVVILGLVIAYIWETVDALGGWSNAFAVLGEIWDGLKESFGASMSAIGGIFKAIGAIIYGAMAEAFARVRLAFANMLGGIQDGINGAIDSVNGIIAGAPKIAEFMGLGSNGIAPVSFADSMIANAEAGLADAYQNTEDAMNDLSDSWAALKDSGSALGIAFNNASSKIAAGKNGIETAQSGNAPGAPAQSVRTGNEPGSSTAPTSTGSAGGGGAGAKAENKYADTVKELREEIAKLNATMFANDLQSKIYENQAKANVTATSAEGQEIARLTTEMEKLEKRKEGLNQLKETFGSIFKGIVTGSMTAREALSNLLSKLAEMLANAAFEQLWSGVLGGLGGGRGGGVFGGLMTLLGFANGTGPSGIPAYANGTAGAAAGLQLVGERGPELTRMPVGTRVWSSAQTAAMLKPNRSHLQVELSPDLIAKTLDQAAQNSVTIVKQGMAAQEKNMPSIISRYEGDRRRR